MFLQTFTYEVVDSDKTILEFYSLFRIIGILFLFLTSIPLNDLMKEGQYED